MLPLILCVLVGGGLGAATGHFGKCSGGGCPLTSTWWRGGLYGALLGAVIGFTAFRDGGEDLNRSTDLIKRLTVAEFDGQVLQAGTPVVVDFYAPWCGPCRAMAPVMERLAGRFARQLRFVKVNVEDTPELAERYHVEGLPTFLFFKGGKVVEGISGALAAEDMEARLRVLSPTGAEGTTNATARN